MARKLFISFLGTGFYNECIYYDGMNSYTPTKFIQQATMEQIGVPSWEKTDAVRIFTTDKAFTDNWDKDNDKRFNDKEKVYVPYTRLGKILNSMKLKADVKPVLHVPVGNNEKEMWKIFQMVFDEIHEGDELYVDLTHALRYLPMLMLVLTNYAKFLKNITVSHISYGNWEAGRQEGRNTVVDGKEYILAPIVNLLQLSQLQDWTTAAADFLQNGYVDKMSELSSNSIRLLQKDVSTRSDDNRKLASFVNTLKVFTEERQTCRGMDISGGKTLEKLHEQSQRIGNIVIKPFKPIFEKVSATLPESGSSLKNCLEAAQWCYQNHLFQQAATILQEGVVTFFCERHDIKIDNEDQRSVVNSAFVIKSKALPQSQWEIAPDKKEKLKEVIDDPLLLQPSVFNAFGNITEIRNDYNHAGFRSKRKPQRPENIKKNIRDALQSFQNCLTKVYETKVHARRVFVNLSNHPSDNWDNTQIAAASVFGEIVDVPFPTVPTLCSDKDMDKLVKKAIGSVLKVAYPACEVTVHVMGEMTLTYRIVSQLKARGIHCVASTSERVVDDIGNGEKISKFHFVSFREY